MTGSPCLARYKFNFVWCRWHAWNPLSTKDVVPAVPGRLLYLPRELLLHAVAWTYACTPWSLRLMSKCMQIIWHCVLQNKRARSLCSRREQQQGKFEMVRRASKKGTCSVKILGESSSRLFTRELKVSLPQQYDTRRNITNTHRSTGRTLNHKKNSQCEQNVQTKKDKKWRAVEIGAIFQSGVNFICSTAAQVEI